jgi:hypothetical protein
VAKKWQMWQKSGKCGKKSGKCGKWVIKNGKYGQFIKRAIHVE